MPCRTSTRGAKVQTSWTGLLGWMLHHNIFSMFLKTHGATPLRPYAWFVQFHAAWMALLTWDDGSIPPDTPLCMSDYVLAQIEEFGPKFIKRWRADLVVLNLGYSLVT
jgi:hypothetical protein